MQNNTSTQIDDAVLSAIFATGTRHCVTEVRDPGFYYVPTSEMEKETLVYFDGERWRTPRVNVGSWTVILTSEVVYGPLEFIPGELPPMADMWPEEGDEFTVFVEVRQSDRGPDGFVLNPPPTLAAMLREYGVDYPMAEEYFGQDFLPEQPGLYRMKLRMYVEPAYQVDDHEWSSPDPGLEVLSIERLTAEPVSVPAAQA